MATAVRPVPRLLVGVGVFASDVSLPNWPILPLPQHETEPSSRIAQVCSPPEDMATAMRPIPRLLVGVGVVASDVAPLPNRPSPPTHSNNETFPSSRITQVCSNPE